MKILSQESNLVGVGTTVSGATMVRTYNSDTSVGIVTRKDADGSTVGSLAIPSKKVVYLEKDFSDKLVAPSTIKASKMGSGPVFEFASWSTTSVTYDTVTFSHSAQYGTSSTSINGDWSVNVSNISSVPRAGKRVYLMGTTYRLTDSSAYADEYPNWFIPSNQTGGTATVTIGLNSDIPTVVGGVGRSAYNGTTFWWGRDDLNSSGSNQTIQIAFDNTAAGYTDPGGFAITLYIFDYVEDFNFNWQSKSNNTTLAETNALDIAPGGTGSGWTSTFKVTSGVNSNTTGGSNPSYTKGAGETDTTYTTQLSGDIGTSERIRYQYEWLASDGEASNMTGKWGVSSGTNNDGIGGIAAHARFRPSWT